ncbi:MAG: helix-turn-helix domain-containing protein [Pyrinomonadaceae bacterium]
MTNVTARTIRTYEKHGATSVITKLAYGLKEIAEATGLSVNFLRYEIKRGNLNVTRFGRRVLVAHDELRKYMETGSEGGRASEDEAL